MLSILGNNIRARRFTQKDPKGPPKDPKDPKGHNKLSELHYYQDFWEK